MLKKLTSLIVLITIFLSTSLPSVFAQTASTSSANITQPSYAIVPKSVNSWNSFSAILEKLVNPYDLFLQIKDEIKRMVIHKLIGVLQSFWIATGTYPVGDYTTGNGWIDELVHAKDLSDEYASFLLSSQPEKDYCETKEQTGYCYFSDGRQATVFVRLEAKEVSERCANNTAFYLWSSRGDFGVACFQKTK